MNINQQRDAIWNSKRNNGNQVKDFYDYFPNVNGQQRQVILKTTDLVNEDAYIYNVHIPAKGYVMCSGRIATRLLNDFPQFIEAVASTMILHNNQFGTYHVEKDYREDPVRKKKIPYYKAKLKYNEPIVFDMAELKLKSSDEIKTEIEESKVQKELDKMRKEMGIKLKAKKLLEQEIGTEISDDDIQEYEVKTKAKGKKK